MGEKYVYRPITKIKTCTYAAFFWAQFPDCTQSQISFPDRKIYLAHWRSPFKIRSNRNISLDRFRNLCNLMLLDVSHLFNVSGKHYVQVQNKKEEKNLYVCECVCVRLVLRPVRCVVSLLDATLALLRTGLRALSRATARILQQTTSMSTVH
jgi:hypothetical protein